MSLSSSLPSICVSCVGASINWHFLFICAGPVYLPFSLAECAPIPFTVYTGCMSSGEKYNHPSRMCKKSAGWRAGSRPGHSQATLCSVAQEVICHGILYFERHRETSTGSDSTARRGKVRRSDGAAQQASSLSTSLWQVLFWESQPLVLSSPSGFCKKCRRDRHTMGLVQEVSIQIIEVGTSGKVDGCF